MSEFFSRRDGHEQIVVAADDACGLRCIVAVHSTALGPSLGGTRFYPYRTEDEALVDVLQLSKAMTYKAAVAQLDIGGGKGVIIGDPKVDKTETVLRAYGRVVESLGGRYIAACDMGTTPADLAIVGRETRWARGTEPIDGGSGDSAISTALGVFLGLKACAQHRWGTDSLRDRHIVIQGVGKVGRRLACLLHSEKARLTIADTDPVVAADVAKQYGADIVSSHEIYQIEADAFSPNAIGHTLNDQTVSRLRCAIVAGAANNQLTHPEIAECMRRRDILYAPDYVINAGGLIQVVDELHAGGPSEGRVAMQLELLPNRLHSIFQLAEKEDMTTADAADLLAEDRIRVAVRDSCWPR